MKRDYTALDDAIVNAARTHGTPHVDYDVVSRACVTCGLDWDLKRVTIQMAADHGVDQLIERRTRAMSRAGRITYDRSARRYRAVGTPEDDR